MNTQTESTRRGELLAALGEAADNGADVLLHFRNSRPTPGEEMIVLAILDESPLAYLRRLLDPSEQESQAPVPK